MPAALAEAVENKFVHDTESGTFLFTPERDGIYNISLLRMSEEYAPGNQMNVVVEVASVAVADENGVTLDGSVATPVNEDNYCTVSVPLAAGEEATITGGAAKIAGLIGEKRHFVLREVKGAELSFDELDANVLVGKEAFDNVIAERIKTFVAANGTPDYPLIPNGDKEALLQQLKFNNRGYPLQLGTDADGVFGWGHMEVNEGAGNFVVDVYVPGHDSVFAANSIVSFGMDYYLNISVTEHTIEADEYGTSTWVTNTSSDTSLLPAIEEIGIHLEQGDEEIVAVAFQGDGLILAQVGKGYGNFADDFDDSVVAIPEAELPSTNCLVEDRVLATVSTTVGTKNRKLVRWCSVTVDEYNNIVFNVIDSK
jgi:hypothetical protein